MTHTIEELLPIFRDVLEDDAITLTEATVASDVPGWDSMNHIYLVVAIEKHFKVKFTTQQIQRWQCVGDIIADLNR